MTILVITEQYKKLIDQKKQDKVEYYLTTDIVQIEKYLHHLKVLYEAPGTPPPAIPQSVEQDFQLLSAVLRWKQGETAAPELVHPDPMIRQAAEIWTRKTL